MSFLKVGSHRVLKPLPSIAAMVIVLYSNACFAAPPDLSTMIANIAEAVPNLMRFVTAFAYVAGMYLIIEGIHKLKKWGEQRSMMSEAGSIRGPLMYMFVGGALLYLPTSVEVGLTTFWENPTPYAYVKETTDAWQQLIQSIFLIVQLIGTIALIRGLLILSHVGGGHGGQQGQFGRAMAHIIGGVLCINIYQFIQTIATTLGLGNI